MSRLKGNNDVLQVQTSITALQCKLTVCAVCLLLCRLHIYIEQSSGMHYQLTLYSFHYNMQLPLAEQRVQCNYMFVATMEPSPRKLYSLTFLQC